MKMKFISIIFVLYLCTPSLCIFGESDGDSIDGSLQHQSFVALRYNTTDGPIFAQGVMIHCQVIIVPAPSLLNVPKEKILVDYPTLRDGRFKTVSEIILHPDYKPCNGYRGFALLVLNDTYSCDPIYLPDHVFESGVKEETCAKLYFNENIAKNLLFNATPEFVTEGILNIFLQSAEERAKKATEKQEVGVTLTLGPYDDEEEQCQNLIPKAFDNNESISDVVCKGNSQIIKNSKSFFRTCQFKPSVYTRVYLFDYHYYAPICAMSSSKEHKYDYRVLYRRENVKEVQSWIMDVLRRTVHPHPEWPFKNYLR